MMRVPEGVIELCENRGVEVEICPTAMQKKVSECHGFNGKVIHKIKKQGIRVNMRFTPFGFNFSMLYVVLCTTKKSCLPAINQYNKLN